MLETSNIFESRLALAETISGLIGGWFRPDSDAILESLTIVLDPRAFAKSL